MRRGDTNREYLMLAAAVVLLARRDAQRDAEARAWLAELQSARPRSIRFTSDDPVMMKNAPRARR
jgi:hypothetical protein